MMTRIYLVRHGATEWNVTKRAQGQVDIEMNGLGQAQAAETAARLAERPIEAVYSSDLKRALDTAAAIALEHGLTVVADPDLREVDQGEWTGLTPPEIRARWPERWGVARHYSTRPGGEAPEQVRARALESLKRIVHAHPDGEVVVVSHGGTIRWISAEALGLDDRASASIRGIGNGGIVCLEGSIDGARLVLSELTRMDGKTPELDDPNV